MHPRCQSRTPQIVTASAQPSTRARPSTIIILPRYTSIARGKKHLDERFICIDQMQFLAYLTDIIAAHALSFRPSQSQANGRRGTSNVNMFPILLSTL